MATSVVTGGAGFLGSHLCEALLAKGHRVVCVDNLETGSLANIEHLRDDAFVFVPHDLTQHVAIDAPVESRGCTPVLIAWFSPGCPNAS